MERIFLGLLVLVPITIAAELTHASPLVVFLLSAAALVPLAKYIGDATEELAAHTTPAVGGLLNATFGNATELIIGVFALNAGLIEVVKASITGSIIGNLLLVLGTSMLFGGYKRERQTFNATAAKASCSMLILATIALVIPAVFLFTSGDGAARAEQELSFLVAGLMIIAYGASLFFSLRTHRHLFKAEAALIVPQWSVQKSVLVLASATVGAAVMSQTLVGTITPVVTQFGWTQLFIGVIVIAIIGNVAEHLSAIQAAVKDRMELAIHISVGSATQIVMFVAPLLVFASLILGHPMNLIFNLFELIAIIFAVFVTNAVVEDGESTWLEGFQLLTAYIIMAVAFFFHG